jgi:hypothetical protein
VFEECGLPGAVATDERDDLVRVHREVDIVHANRPVGIRVSLTLEIDQR